MTEDVPKMVMGFLHLIQLLCAFALELATRTPAVARFGKWTATCGTLRRYQGGGDLNLVEGNLDGIVLGFLL